MGTDECPPSSIFQVKPFIKAYFLIKNYYFIING
jgi:hypothetical protein